MQNDSKLIEQMQEVRKKNNGLWMQITKITMEKGGEMAQQIMKQINETDVKISKVVTQMEGTVLDKDKHHYLLHTSLDNLEALRTHNNSNWMYLLRLGIKCAFKETMELLSQIGENDKQVNEITKKLSEGETE